MTNEFSSQIKIIIILNKKESQIKKRKGSILILKNI